MDTGDAPFAEMPRSPANRDADPLALDEDTVERLLTGALPPAQAPAGYTAVAQLLAAAAAAPTPEELAGHGAVLAELRAMARARSAAAMATGRARPPRRRRRGLAVVIVVGALAMGGVAGAATGHLPAPVREAARTIIGAAGSGTPSGPTTGQPPTSATGTPTADGTGGAGLKGSRPAGAPGSGSEPGSTGAGPAAGPALEGLCEAFAAGDGAERGGKLDATAFEELARAAGGEEKVAAYCEDLLPGDQKLKDAKKAEQPKPPEPPEQPEPSGSGGQGQGSPPPSTGGGGSSGGRQDQGGPPAERERAP
jgi:uncharacterized membrane protein YgcG